MSSQVIAFDSSKKSYYWLRVPGAPLYGWQGVEGILSRLNLQEAEVGWLARLCPSNAVKRVEDGEVELVVRQPILAAAHAVNAHIGLIGFAALNFENQRRQARRLDAVVPNPLVEVALDVGVLFA